MKGTKKARLFTFLLIIGCLPLFIVRCTPEKQFRALSFFFDGVPDPNKQDVITSETVSDSTVTIVKPIAPEFFGHKPYDENKCESCHEKGFSNSLLMPMPELCYTCHEDFNIKYKTLHGPVATGYCTACHNQHMSKLEKLLLRPGQELCLFCHESEQVFKNNLHAEIGEKNCTECHNPHGGENRGMLTAESCNNCHENFKTKYTVLHGPVATGYCTACHTSHASQTPKLLVRESQQLCLYCHQADQVFKNEAHKKNKKTNCTVCHNPHGGEDRYILLQSIQPPKRKPSAETTKQTVTDSLSKIQPQIPEGTDSILKTPVLPVENLNTDSIK